MCGIVGFFGNKNTNTNTFNNRRTHFLNLSKKIRHRGPDWNGVYFNPAHKIFIGHERLSIVGVDGGSQPIISNDGRIVLSVNGEIYNHKELMEYVLHSKYNNYSGSDCEVIIYLYLEFGEACVKMLDGVFSFILYDTLKDTILIARDPIGVIPLYYGITNKCEIMVASEYKCLTDDCVQIQMYPPRHFTYIRSISTINLNETLTNITIENYYNPSWTNYKFIDEYNKTNENTLCKLIESSLTKSVSKRLMCEVPFGVLLSGGLDSSLIASIASRIIKNKNNTLYGHKLHTFSIGLIDSPDLIAAQKVATYLDTIHHAFTFTLQEGLDALSELIYHLETYDITTIRASTPMFLLSRKIKALGIKMVLSGEGADEIFGGYLYFHQSPSNIEFHNECKKRVLNLHHFDCLRANKSTMAWGLEARVPFLDQEFMEHTMNIHPQHKLKNGIEKYILRKAFDTSTNPYLPESILWRQKEQFSDGVGYGWIDTLIKISNNKYTEEEFKLAISSYSNNVPKTKEALMYREIYNSIFTKNININISQWIPRTDWKNVSYDPSGRSQHIHTNKYET